MAVHNDILAVVCAHPVTIILAIGTIWAYGIFVLYNVVLKPIGKRRGKNGHLYRLPPGPKGAPILGSLMDVAKTKDDTEHKWVGS